MQDEEDRPEFAGVATGTETDVNKTLKPGFRNLGLLKFVVCD